jgi:adenylate cyclase
MAENPNGDTNALYGTLRELHDYITPVGDGLRGQDALLRIRGLSVPTIILHHISQLESELTNLEHALIDDETELSQLQALANTSALINSSLDVDGVLAEAMDQIVNLSGAERGYIVLLNEAGTFDFRVMRALEGEPTTHDVSRTILNAVLESGEPLVSDNASNDPRMQETETLARFVLRSVLCVPLIYKERTIGAIYVDNRYREGVFTEREVNLMMAFANQTAIAIENAILFANVQATLQEITQVKDLMENVFTSIDSGVITTGAEDTVTLFNRAAGQILNKPIMEAIGAKLPQVLPVPADELDEPLQTVREQNKSLMLETQAEVQGRGRTVLNLKFSPLKNADQETQGIALVVDDLTEQRERDEALAVMRRYLPPGMIENIHQIAGLALGGERRDVTCAFIYVCPYTIFPAEPAAWMDLLNTYLETATDAIHAAQGIIDKYMGNEIMVLFNTQLNPQPDHALRAVNMALDLRDAFIRLYKRLGQSADQHLYRIGINSGVATLGNVGSLNRRNFTAIGDSINLAKRLEEVATDGQILISEDTLLHLGDLPASIRLAERAAIQVKGRQQVTRMYEVFR